MRVFTDGACSGNPGPGGWAWASEDGRQASGGDPQTTNQRMELQAVLEAVRAVPGPIEIVSDSTYVVNCFNDGWHVGWRARGWRTAAKKPVANRDLWEPLIEEYLRRADEITFTWVKGHSGDPMNDLVDRLAVEAAGQARPVPVVPTPPGPEAVPWPIHRAVWIVGVTDLDRDQRRELGRVIDRLVPQHDVLVSGLRRGSELEAAERAVANGVALAVVLPFADPARGWPAAEQARFGAMLAAARHCVTLDGDDGQPGRAIAERDRWIPGVVAGAIVVGDPARAEALDAEGLSVVAI